MQENGMAVDTQQIMDEAEKLGMLVAQHPAIARYKQAQKAIADDAEATRLFAEFERELESLDRQQMSGLPPTDAQRHKLESLQSRLASHIKIKALNMAQVDFIDLLRKVTQTIQKPLGADRAAAPAGKPAGTTPAASPAGQH
jgi:cell fate (sporulation/competence/biofilm development) regulator YlbF (YheA/YmcA/DUF963 family)